MATPSGQPSWKTPLPYQQQTVETKTFSWRLKSQLVNKGAISPVANNPISTITPTFTPASKPGGKPNIGKVTSTASPVQSSTKGLNPLEEQFLRFQEFEIEAGQSLGLPSIWSIFLVSCGSTTGQKSNTNLTTAISTNDSDFVGLFLRKILPPVKPQESSYPQPDVGDEEVFIKYKLQIMDREGEVLHTQEYETKATSRDKLEEGYWDWKKIEPLSKFQGCGKSGAGSNDEQLTSEDSLLLRVSFTVIIRRKDIPKNRQSSASARLPPDLSEEESSKKESANAFLSLVTNSKSTQPDVVIEITSRRRFLVHKKILVGRSSVFSKMLSTDLAGKSRSIVKIDDISAGTMELVLKHIYTGQLETDWTSHPVTATELIYASEKYWLPALKEFCNKHLVNAATRHNCYKLMEVAQLHNLEKATDDLLAFAAEGIASASSSRKPSEESIQIKS